MGLPTMPKTGEALSDPKPEDNMGLDTSWVGKVYHLVWSGKNKGQLVMHKGESQKCRRVHHMVDGSKFEKTKA